MASSVFAVILSSVALNALAQVFLRKAMLAVGPLSAFADAPLRLVFAVVLQPALIAGMLCYSVSIMAWLFVLSKVEVSAAYPFLSIGYVIAALVGFFFLGENVTLLRIIGIALICGGLIFISRST